MKIVYCARFDQPQSNDDEGAVIHALRELGHEVVPCREEMASRWLPKMSGELLLFNKGHFPETLAKVRSRFGKIVFWYWDLVDWPDPTLARRCEARVKWMEDVVPLVDVGFCTDGDWVERFNLRTENDLPPFEDKLRWLPQGADGRTAGRYPPADVRPKILFTGISRGGGRDRESFVHEMLDRYGEDFLAVEKGLHGEPLARLVAAAGIVVAPDSPVTGRYWSNRVWLTLGFGGFLLHPFTTGLSLTMYEDGEDLVYYDNREHMHRLISQYSSQESKRREIAEAGLKRTIKQHLYLHRVQELMATIRGLQ